MDDTTTTTQPVVDPMQTVTPTAPVAPEPVVPAAPVADPNQPTGGTTL